MRWPYELWRADGIAEKALAKLASWGGFLPLALRDPRGVDTLGALGAKAIAPPGTLVPLSAVGALVLCGLGALAAWSWRRQHASAHAPAGRAGVLAVAALFGTVLAVWVTG